MSKAGPAEIIEVEAAEPRLDLSQSWMLEFQSGALWRVTSETDLDYLLLPQLITLEAPPHSNFEIFGQPATLGPFFRLAGEIVARGPESYYLALTIGPVIEIWSESRTVAFYFRPGGGAGLVDSTGVPGGQGQDFTLNWVLEAGVRFAVSDNLMISAGIYYQHMSNLGMSDPNPGLDTLGPLLGISYSF